MFLLLHCLFLKVLPQSFYSEGVAAELLQRWRKRQTITPEDLLRQLRIFSPE
jgi:hypothetical protein